MPLVLSPWTFWTWPWTWTWTWAWQCHPECHPEYHPWVGLWQTKFNVSSRLRSQSQSHRVRARESLREPERAWARDWPEPGLDNLNCLKFKVLSVIFFMYKTFLLTFFRSVFLIPEIPFIPKLTSLSTSPSLKSEPQILKGQIQKGKGEFGLWTFPKVLDRGSIRSGPR